MVKGIQEEIYMIGETKVCRKKSMSHSKAHM